MSEKQPPGREARVYDAWKQNVRLEKIHYLLRFIKILKGSKSFRIKFFEKFPFLGFRTEGAWHKVSSFLKLRHTPLSTRVGRTEV